MNIALIGYGKMGKAIESFIAEQNAAGKHAPIEIIFKGGSKDDIRGVIGADAVIECTAPEHAVANILACFEMGIPVVCGTTGWYDQLPLVRQACADKQAALIYASNFSIGVSIIFHLNKILAQHMRNRKEYMVQIEETHHTAKKDAPSGTAITLAEQIMQHDPEYTHWVKGEAKDAHTIPVISYREENIPGTHIVTWSSEIDELEIKHIAHGRKGFAHGAVEAAMWIQNKKGVYTLDDMMGVH